MGGRFETPVGKVNSVVAANTSNPGSFPRKWWVTCKEDLKVFAWMEERAAWHWNEERFRELSEVWRGLGLPTIFMPRVNAQHLFIDIMGVSLIQQ